MVSIVVMLAPGRVGASGVVSSLHQAPPELLGSAVLCVLGLTEVSGALVRVAAERSGGCVQHASRRESDDRSPASRPRHPLRVCNGCLRDCSHLHNAASVHATAITQELGEGRSSPRAKLQKTVVSGKTAMLTSRRPQGRSQSVDVRADEVA